VTARLVEHQPNQPPQSKPFNDGNLARRPRAKTHSDVVNINTGWKLDPERWAIRIAASEAQKNESERIADALGRAGVNVRVPSEITVIGAVTGSTEVIAGFRAVRFLPSVAARDRRPMLDGLTFFIQSHPSARYFRYQVFTAPEPVPMGGKLRATIQILSRKISRWASRQSENFGVETLFRGIEFTRATAEERGMEDRYPPDTILYHVHANVLVWPTRSISAEWDDYLKSTGKMFQAHWHDNGRLQNPNEVVKYLMKQGCLDRASDDEIAWLYKETRRLKFSQPIGAFAEFMGELEDRREKIARVKGTRDGKLVRVSKARRLDHGKREVVTEAASAEAPSLQKPSLPPTNIILGLSLPQRRFTPWAEPMILVQRYKPTATSNGDIERLEAIRAEMQYARMRWDKNGAPAPAEALSVAALYLQKQVIEPPKPVITPSNSTVPRADYNVHSCRPTVPSQQSTVDAEHGPRTAPFVRPELGLVGPTVPPEHWPVDAEHGGAQTEAFISPQDSSGLIRFIRGGFASLERGFARFKNALQRRWKAP
jgi:hypothetical protein